MAKSGLKTSFSNAAMGDIDRMGDQARTHGGYKFGTTPVPYSTDDALGNGGVTTVDLPNGIGPEDQLK